MATVPDDANAAPRLSFTPKHHRQLSDGNWTLDLGNALLMTSGLLKPWSRVHDQLLQDRLAEVQRIKAEGGAVVIWDPMADNSEAVHQARQREQGE